LADNELKKRKSLPFPAASQTFYQKQGYLSRHNEKRSELRIKFPVKKNEKGNVGVHRSCTTGTLAENIIELREQLQGPNSLCYPAHTVRLKLA
jgi:putative component of toxin-antitoxin plasmid stabilization module